jgi:plastocyanin
MRLITPTLSLCALAVAFTAGALTVDAPPPAAPPSVPSATAAAPGEPAVITISAFAFSAVTAAPGSTVRVVNLDTVAHTVTADDGSFDVFVEPGAETTFTAPGTAGSFAFTCQVHPSMTGVLAVA